MPRPAACATSHGWPSMAAPTGWTFSARCSASSPRCLAVGGVALLEIGAGQGPTLRDTIDRLPMRAAVTALPDLAGIERAIRIARL